MGPLGAEYNRDKRQIATKFLYPLLQPPPQPPPQPPLQLLVRHLNTIILCYLPLPVHKIINACWIVDLSPIKYNNILVLLWFAKFRHPQPT